MLAWGWGRDDRGLRVWGLDSGSDHSEPMLRSFLVFQSAKLPGTNVTVEWGRQRG